MALCYFCIFQCLSTFISCLLRKKKILLNISFSVIPKSYRFETTCVSKYHNLGGYFFSIHVFKYLTGIYGCLFFAIEI